MNYPRHYAFLDESGTVAPFSGSQFLIVAQVRTPHPRSLELTMKRVRKKYGRSLASGELKASESTPALVEHVLQTLVQEQIKINATIVDKRTIVRPPTDVEEIYCTAVAQTIHHAALLHAILDVYLDRRYTTQRQRDRLERTIREQVAELPQQILLIRQEDSVKHKGLQAVDFIAWAFFQKYERGDDRFYQLIVESIDQEDVIARPLW